MSSLSRLVNGARIPLETSHVVVSEDGSLRAATEHEDSIEIVGTRDMLPVPRNSPERTWGFASVMGFFVAEAFSISQYQVASTSVNSGLSPGATIGAVLLGHFIVACGASATAWVGSVYGINFPAYGRTAFGFYGTYLCVAVRAIAAIVWFATQTYQGGQCVEVMLRAIWPSFKHFPNHLPASAHVTSSQLLCYFIFFIVQLPFLYIHISKLRHLFMAKIILMPIFGITLFGWAVGSAGGFGKTFSRPTKIIDGRPVAVVFFQAMSSAISPKATLSLNICDFSRYAKSPKNVVAANMFSLTILVTLAALLGVVVTSAAEVIYGVTTWNPLQVSSLMGNRAAQFFSALMWALAALVTNISANSTAVGNDLMILLPEYISIRRGQYICAIIGTASCPWLIQATAKTFTSFLSGYTVFLAPLGGVLMSEVFLVRRGKIALPELHRRHSAYWYNGGINLRAIASFVFGIVPTLPGFVRTINPKLNIPIQATYVTACVYPVGVVVAGLSHYLLSTIFPPAPLPTSYSSRSLSPSLDEEDVKEKDLTTSSIVPVTI
ncbi:nucleobase cation symporter-1 family protein [Sporobolomyces salmoneus]|uniref:nucleobase cation symporter-1 family protein n=1 Tax=Sporobolomyces salmoneus TaxID=183962 RepID=UPI00316DB4B1